jgi:hypothetical protein
MNVIEIEYMPQIDEYLEAYSLYEAKTLLRTIDKIKTYTKNKIHG